MRETKIERQLREGVESMGGLCLKFVSPGRRGPPDRLILMPFMYPHMVETKAPGKEAEDHQLREHERYRRMHMPVFVRDTPEAVVTHLNWIWSHDGRQP